MTSKAFVWFAGCPAVDDSMGQAITWMSGPSCASVDGLSSTACFGHDTQLYGVSTASEQVPVPYRRKDPYGGTLASSRGEFSDSVYGFSCSACIAKDMLLEYLKVKTEGALAQTKPELDPVQMSGQSLSLCCCGYACILPPCSLKRGFQPERQRAETL